MPAIKCAFRLLLLVCALMVLCQSATATPLLTLRFEHLGLAQGLASDSVEAFAQDQQGFLWIGGQGGLSRYDGYSVKNYRAVANQPYSLAKDYVRALHVDTRGRLWIGTNGGLNLYDRANDRFLLFRPPAAGPTSADIFVINRIINDGKDGMWLGTSGGLQHFNPATGQFSMLRHNPADNTSLVNDDVLALTRDANGTLWVGTSKGLDSLSAGQTAFQHFRMDEVDAKHNSIQSLLVDQHHILWIGTVRGLETWRIAGNGAPARRRFTDAEGLPQLRITNLLEDRTGDIWVAAFGRGLLRWDTATGRFVTFPHQPNDAHSVVDDQVFSLFQDRTGTLWVGTHGNGASHVDLASGGFVRFTQKSGGSDNLSSNKISKILDAGPGQVWVETHGGGLDLLRPATGDVTIFRHDVNDPASLDDDRLMGLAADAQGTLWVGSETGITRFDPVTRRVIGHAATAGQPVGGSIEQLQFDHAGILWVTSAAGLYRLDPVSNVWSRFQPDPKDPASLAAKFTSGFLEDRQGRVWLGTGSGLERLDRTTGRFDHYVNDPAKPNSLSAGLVFTVYESTQGTLWIGNVSGLNRMTVAADGRASFKLYPVSGGVAAILEDSEGRLWVSTDAGISRFDPATGQFKNYTAHEGMAEGDYNVGSSLHGADGMFYFGTSSGLTAFRPENIRDNPSPPQVMISDVQVFNHSLQVGKEVEGITLKAQIQDTKALSLAWMHSVFSIKFAALHFADPQRNKYAYRLEGFDRDWTTTDASSRIATYTNLDPGDYVFRVKASNKDGLWNETGASLRITITPPYWKTWWFRTVFAALLLLGLRAAYRNRVRGFVRQRKLLEHQVDVRTVEVLEKNTLIAQKNLALEQSNEALEDAMLELATSNEALVTSNQALEATNDALSIAHQIQADQQSELTRFLAVASHDLRQPMHALNIYLGALSQFDLPATALPVLGSVNQCARIMDDMFRALLDLSRLDARIVEPMIAAFPIASLLARLKVEFKPQADAKGLALHMGPSDVWVSSDAGLLEQLLRNLLANAVRYTDTGTITVRCNVRDRRVHIAVQDTGIGISAHQQKTVFEEFCQLGNTNRDRAIGLGLGLAIVKRLCKLLDTPITLVSAPGQGSTFAIEVPLAAPQVQDYGSPDFASATNDLSLNGKLIVVIDDEQSILAAMRLLLEQWGCAVVTAMSGQEAMSRLAGTERVPDALICDYRLRVTETGPEAIALLQAEFNRDLPALLITGDTAPALLQQILSCGVPVLYKPVQASILRDALVRLLERG